MGRRLANDQERFAQKAVLDFARARSRHYSGEAINRFRRHSAKRLFAFNYPTLWDEFCHYVQHEPEDSVSEYMWFGGQLAPIVTDIVASIPPEEKVLLAVAAKCWHPYLLDDDGEGAIAEHLLAEIRAAADDRDLSQFQG